MSFPHCLEAAYEIKKILAEYLSKEKSSEDVDVQWTTDYRGYLPISSPGTLGSGDLKIICV